ncbi:MAG TPA: hypothetical protein VKB38_21560 [Terracidiphilus sp.]|nr:hypothetical protein [Terracidiphilus sp.]
MDTPISDCALLEARLRRQLPNHDSVRLDGTPNFPLAFQTPLPEGFAGEHGDIGIQFEEFTVSGVETFALDRNRTVMKDNSVTLGLRWDQLEVTGRYRLTAKATPRITLDTGGGMMDLEDEDHEVREAGAPGDAPIDSAERNAMLDRARDQRTRLMDTPNGQQLMSRYNEHNEAYNDVFIKRQSARTAWTANGATKEMALHTHTSLDPNAVNTTVVNPPAEQARFGRNQVTYNSNAWNQQLQIAVNTASLGFNIFKKGEKPDPNNKYVKASLAALTFGKGVQGTGNTRDNINAMTGNQVYGAVNDGKKPPDATVDELVNMIDQSSKPGGAAAAVALSRNWRVLDEEDRRLVRRQLFLVAREQAEEETIPVETLWSGDCKAAFGGAVASVEFALEDGVLRFTRASAMLPAFELDIDDSQWQGEVADLARKRIAEIAFLRSLICERIQSGLADRLGEAVRKAQENE